MARRVSEAVGAQVAQARTRCGWTQQAFADAIRETDPTSTLTRAAVAKIESGVRHVSLDELLLLALTLDVPLPVLLLPLHDGGDVAVTGATSVEGWTAYEWMRGGQPLRDAGQYVRHTAILHAYEHVQAAQTAAKTAAYRVESAEALGRDAGRFIADYVDALERLSTAMRDLEDAGADPKPLVDKRLAKALRDRKIEPRPRRVVRLSNASEEA